MCTCGTPHGVTVCVCERGKHPIITPHCLTCPFPYPWGPQHGSTALGATLGFFRCPHSSETATLGAKRGQHIIEGTPCPLPERMGQTKPTLTISDPVPGGVDPFLQWSVLTERATTLYRHTFRPRVPSHILFKFYFP